MNKSPDTITPLRLGFALAFFLLLQACAAGNYATEAYRQTSNKIQKNYQLSHADLIISYDLAKTSSNSNIYPDDLGLVTNRKSYAEKYMEKFKSRYKSPTSLARESRKKITKICKLLLSLHSKHAILSSSNYHNIKRISQLDLNQIEGKKELFGLDRIMASLPIMLPAYKPEISSWYGNRRHPRGGGYGYHNGIDLVAASGTPIYASGGGRISFTGIQNGYGLVIDIDHGNNVKTKYAHLRKVMVKQGQKVMRGQEVALQGNTGNARKEHLHFEVHIAGRHINPYDFIGHNYGV